MKVQMLIVLGVVASLLVMSSTASTPSLFIDYVYTCSDNCYVVTDPVIRTVTYTAEDEIIPKEQPLPYTSAPAERPTPQVDVTLTLPICWHLDYGYLADFDWDVVVSGLNLVYDVQIGQMKTVNVRDFVKPVPCYSATVDIRAAYVRDVYRIQRGDKIALVSVVTPTDGATRVYRNVERNVYCNGGNAELTDAEGLCAAINRPFLGTDCAGGNKKWHPMDQPATNPDVETSTWGKIKSAYSD